MAKFISRRRFTIEWGHCDPAGIVFNSHFFEFFDWGTWLLFEAALGVKPPDLAAAFGIAGLPLVDAGARFLAPARFGDHVELTSYVSEFRRSSFDVEHRLMIGNTVAVEGRETRVWAARDPADPSKMKSQPIPAEVTARFIRDDLPAVGRDRLNTIGVVAMEAAIGNEPKHSTHGAHSAIYAQRSRSHRRGRR
jgi:4-hydroxybenzoyl-CoA thioesterase